MCVLCKTAAKWQQLLDHVSCQNEWKIFLIFMVYFAVGTQGQLMTHTIQKMELLSKNPFWQNFTVKHYLNFCAKIRRFKILSFWFLGKKWRFGIVCQNVTISPSYCNFSWITFFCYTHQLITPQGLWDTRDIVFWWLSLCSLFL